MIASKIVLLSYGYAVRYRKPLVFILILIPFLELQIISQKYTRGIGIYPAVMIHLKMIRSQTGDRILPVLFSDNYITLMPGEERTIAIEFEHADTRGEQPIIAIEGLNVE